MSAEPFHTRYCARHGLAAGVFRVHLLARAVYPHARLLVPLLSRLDRQHFQADYEFIDDVGDLRGTGAFEDAAENYAGHFSNRAFLRQQLRLRISVRRMWRIVREIMTEEPPPGLEQRLTGQGSFTPFARKPPE